MRRFAISLAVCAALLGPDVSWSAGGTCPDEPCGCDGPDPVYLVPYIVPNYPGWQTAKRVWTMDGVGSSHLRVYSYAPGKYELIKSADGKSTETFQVMGTWVVVTSEFAPEITGGFDSRYFLGSGLKWFPTSICPNNRYFGVCHQGEMFIDENTCGTIGWSNPHCMTYRSRIDFAPTWNYGYSIGIVNSIIKVDKLDDGSTEKYWYGLNRGLLRWEHWSPNGVLLHWGQQTNEIANSPIQHNTCSQP